ncbi:MAG: siphovirus Gp157 family protein [Oscillospiraceae bacterium]|nr:siphovirus Gp157 family protein [Oscillospiraceae bacterium]
MKLYQINEAILDCIDTDSGEILDAEKLAELFIAKEEKIKNVGEWYLNLLAEAKALKEEKEKFAARQKAAENKAESLKRWLDFALQGERFKTTTVQITYRKSEQVVIDDVYKIDEKYLKYAEPTADKAEIKKALKQGEEILGARLEQKTNISIK